MTVSIDGIVSNLDTTALIEASVAVQRAPMLLLAQRAKDYEAQKESVAGIRNRLVTLSDSIRKMDTLGEFRSYAVFPQPTTTFSITANQGAQTGSYAIRVDQLARAQTSASQGFDTRDAALGTGTFSVTVGGVTTDVTVDAGNDTLEDFAESLDAIPGLSAYLIDTGTTVGRFKLMVQGDDTGGANAITFDSSGMGGGAIPAFTTSASTTALDAQIDLGGITLTSSTNKFDAALPGIEIDLLTVGTAETVTVSRDAAAMAQKLSDVVDAYNAIRAFQDTQTVFNLEAGIRGPLFGEATTRNAVNDVSETLMNRFTVAGTDLQSLAQLGVKTERDGSLSFDTDAFAAVFAADPTSVETFLTSVDGPLTVIADRIDETYVDPDNGVLVSREESLESTIAQLNESIDASQERLDSLAARLREQYTAMELILGRIQSTESYLTSFFDSLTAPAK